MTVSFTGENSGQHEAKLVINSSNNNVLTSYSSLLAYVVTPADNLAGIAGPQNDRLSWYSGGDRPWRSNIVEGVESGNIGNLQESILLALVEGPGQLSFEWGVSSEANTDDPTDPFDILALSIDGDEIEFISGEVPIANFVDNQGLLTLPSGQHLIAWTYSKDPATVDGQDKGFVKNVVFDAQPIPEPTPTPEPQPSPNPAPAPSEQSSGGGSIFWLIGLLVAIRTFRRRSF